MTSICVENDNTLPGSRVNLVHLLDRLEKLTVVSVSIVGLLGLLVAVSHALYLGFNLLYAYPAILFGLLLVGLVFGYRRFGKLFSGIWTSPVKTLLVIIGIGLVLRIVTMLNPNASEDEWKYVFTIAQNNPLDLGNFVRNFNNMEYGLAVETTPLPFILMKLGYLLSATLQGARLIPTILNVLLIPITYYLARELSSEKVARTTAFLYAINPASLFFLNAADTDIFLFFFGMAGLLLFVRGYKANSLKYVISSGLMFGLAFWSKATLTDLWLAVVVLLALALLSKRGKSRNLLYVGIVGLIAVATFLPWGAADPYSFNNSFIQAPYGVLQQLTNPANFDLGGSGNVLSQSTTTTAFTNSTLTNYATKATTSPNIQTTKTTPATMSVIASSSTTSTASSSSASSTTSSSSASSTSSSQSKTTTSAAVETTSQESSSLTNTTSATATQTQRNGSTWSDLLRILALPDILPLFQAGSGTYTSFFDVIAQIPFWFGSFTIIVGVLFLFYGLFTNNKRGMHLAMLLWVLAILIPLLSVQRDIRYFVDIATFPVLFVAAEAVDLRRKSLTRALEILIIAFAIIFLVLGIVVGYEYTSGISEASQFVNQNYPHPIALVNYGGFDSLLSPGGKVIPVPLNATVLNSTLSSTNYDVVLIWYQARTTGASDQLVSVLNSYYAHHVVFGLSNFSYVTVYYGYTGTK